MGADPVFTVGVEEEYLLVDLETRDLVPRMPPTLLAECAEQLGPRVSPEFLQCQVEIGTEVCSTHTELRSQLVHARRSVSEAAGRHGMGIIAASTHPFAQHGAVRRTERDRYAVLADDLQEVVRRLVISGMHVHVGIDETDERIDSMAQATYLLPHLLALSTSSPFWEGAESGLQSYRVAVWDELPRTGLPESFDSWSAYERHVAVLVDAGIIEDATKIWWDLRPSHRYPTLELRICDLPTYLDDTVCLASLYRCWLRFLWRLRRGNQRWRCYSPMLVAENRWRAQRYGTTDRLIDFGKGELVPFPELMDELLDLIAPDAEALGCEEAVARVSRILDRGTSSQRQIRRYHEARDAGAEIHEALVSVVDMLLADTLEGCSVDGSPAPGRPGGSATVG